MGNCRQWLRTGVGNIDDRPLTRNHRDGIGRDRSRVSSLPSRDMRWSVSTGRIVSARRPSVDQQPDRILVSRPEGGRLLRADRSRLGSRPTIRPDPSASTSRTGGIRKTPERGRSVVVERRTSSAPANVGDQLDGSGRLVYSPRGEHGFARNQLISTHPSDAVWNPSCLTKELNDPWQSVASVLIRVLFGRHLLQPRSSRDAGIGGACTVLTDGRDG